MKNLFSRGFLLATILFFVFFIQERVSSEILSVSELKQYENRLETLAQRMKNGTAKLSEYSGLSATEYENI